jgi:hypothetical protein
VELQLFLGQRMKGLDKLSGGKVRLYPCDAAKQTLLIDTPVRD